MTPNPAPPTQASALAKLWAAVGKSTNVMVAAILVGTTYLVANVPDTASPPAPTTTTISAAPPTTAPPPVTSTAPPTTTSPVPTTTTLPSSAKPGAANTGVPAGTVLQPSSGFTASVAGQVFDRLDVNGTVTIAANDVTIQRSRIRGVGFHVVYALDGVTGFRLTDSEIDGLGVNGSDGSDGIFGQVTATRVDVHGVENGAQLSSGSTITASFIHDLAAPGAPHYDGVEIDGARSNIVVRGNTIISNPFQTSAVMIDNYFGPTDNVTVDGNWLYGGGYTLYVDSRQGTAPITRVTITRNRFGLVGCTTVVPPCAQYGRVALYNAITQSGNLDDASGAAITL